MAGIFVQVANIVHRSDISPPPGQIISSKSHFYHSGRKKKRKMKPMCLRFHLAGNEVTESIEICKWLINII